MRIFCCQNRGKVYKSAWNTELQKEEGVDVMKYHNVNRGSVHRASRPSSTERLLCKFQKGTDVEGSSFLLGDCSVLDFSISYVFFGGFFGFMLRSGSLIADYARRSGEIE